MKWFKRLLGICDGHEFHATSSSTWYMGTFRKKEERICVCVKCHKVDEIKPADFEKRGVIELEDKGNIFGRMYA